MTDKLYCPWCGDELIFAHKLKGIQTCVCRNPTCKYDGYHFPVEVIQQLIDGKKAQDALKVATNYIKWTIDTFEKGLDREADIGGYGEIVLEKISKIITDTKD